MSFSFYKELNKLSMADFYQNSKTRQLAGSKEFYKIERIVSRRVRGGKVSAVMKLYICWVQSLKLHNHEVENVFFGFKGRVFYSMGKLF